jgi:hypothetical protein
MSFLNAMAKARSKEPFEKWSLEGGHLRMAYCHYKFRDREHWHMYEQLYIDKYWKPIRDARNALKPRHKTAFEMFMSGPFGEFAKGE